MPSKGQQSPRLILLYELTFWIEASRCDTVTKHYDRQGVTFYLKLMNEIGEEELFNVDDVWWDLHKEEYRDHYYKSARLEYLRAELNAPEGRCCTTC